MLITNTVAANKRNTYLFRSITLVFISDCSGVQQQGISTKQSESRLK